jgi:hypothetical protein
MKKIKWRNVVPAVIYGGALSAAVSIWLHTGVFLGLVVFLFVSIGAVLGLGLLDKASFIRIVLALALRVVAVVCAATAGTMYVLSQMHLSGPAFYAVATILVAFVVFAVERVLFVWTKKTWDRLKMLDQLNSYRFVIGQYCLPPDGIRNQREKKTDN